MLSNNGSCLCAAAQYVLLFLVRFNNSDRFQIYVVTRSYSSRPFLRALGTVLLVWDLLRLAPTNPYQLVLLTAPLPTLTEFTVPSSAGQAGPLLPAVSPQWEGDHQRMQKWELSSQSGRRVNDNRHWNNYCCLFKWTALKCRTFGASSLSFLTNNSSSDSKAFLRFIVFSGSPTAVHRAFLFFDAKAWPQSQTDSSCALRYYSVGIPFSDA